MLILTFVVLTTRLFTKIFDVVWEKKFFPGRREPCWITADEFAQHSCALVLSLKGQWHESLRGRAILISA